MFLWVLFLASLLFLVLFLAAIALLRSLSSPSPFGCEGHMVDTLWKGEAASSHKCCFHDRIHGVNGGESRFWAPLMAWGKSSSFALTSYGRIHGGLITRRSSKVKVSSSPISSLAPPRPASSSFAHSPSSPSSSPGSPIPPLSPTSSSCEAAAMLAAAMASACSSSESSTSSSMATITATITATAMAYSRNLGEGGGGEPSIEESNLRTGTAALPGGRSGMQRRLVLEIRMSPSLTPDEQGGTLPRATGVRLKLEANGSLDSLPSVAAAMEEYNREGESGKGVEGGEEVKETMAGLGARSCNIGRDAFVGLEGPGITEWGSEELGFASGAGKKVGGVEDGMGGGGGKGDGGEDRVGSLSEPSLFVEPSYDNAGSSSVAVANANSTANLCNLGLRNGGQLNASSLRFKSLGGLPVAAGCQATAEGLPRGVASSSKSRTGREGAGFIPCVKGKGKGGEGASPGGRAAHVANSLRTTVTATQGAAMISKGAAVEGLGSLRISTLETCGRGKSSKECGRIVAAEIASALAVLEIDAIGEQNSISFGMPVGGVVTPGSQSKVEKQGGDKGENGEGANGVLQQEEEMGEGGSGSEHGVEDAEEKGDGKGERGLGSEGMGGEEEESEEKRRAKKKRKNKIRRQKKAAAAVAAAASSSSPSLVENTLSERQERLTEGGGKVGEDERGVKQQPWSAQGVSREVELGCTCKAVRSSFHAVTCPFPFTSSGSMIQRKIKEQYDELVRANAAKTLTLAQVGRFTTCLVEAKACLQHKSETLQRRFTIAKSLLAKAEKSSFDRLCSQIYGLELEQKKLEEDTVVYNRLQDQLKQSPAYQKMLEYGRAHFELQPKSGQLIEKIEEEEISFEELLAQEKKDTFWQKHGVGRSSVQVN